MDPKCRICQREEATLPEGGSSPGFCPRCWETRLRQLFREEDRFHIQRTIRTADAEKLIIYHADHEGGELGIGVVFALHDRRTDHLEVHAFLNDQFPWQSTVPLIYEQGVEADIELIEVLLGILQHDLSSSWPCRTFSIEVARTTGDPIWIDNRERPEDEVDAEDESIP
jgi:hypothetical protein